MRYADMYCAYKTLPEDIKALIDGRLLIHDETYNSAGQLRKGFKPVTDPRWAPGARHPIVRTHPVSGRDALFLGRRRNAYILGLELEESERVLDALWEHARKRWISFESWQPGDILIWDNRCTLHLRTGFDPADHSVLHRVQVKGEKPFNRWTNPVTAG